jgi:hypothetical protein
MGWFRDEVELRVRLAVLWVRRNTGIAVVLLFFGVWVVGALVIASEEEPADPRPTATRSAPAATETEFEVDPGQLRRLAMLSVWQQSSAADRAGFCEAYRVFGPQVSYELFISEGGDNPPTLSEFRSFFDDRC